jgi:hypothetical protein
MMASLLTASLFVHVSYFRKAARTNFKPSLAAWYTPSFEGQDGDPRESFPDINMVIPAFSLQIRGLGSFTLI